MSKQQRTLLWIGGTRKTPSRVEPTATSADPSPSTIGAVYTEDQWLAGDAPLMRADFLQVLDACSEPISLRTQGLALTEPELVQALKDRGVQRICIPIFSIRPDAHDWLVGRKGAVRRSLKAIRVCVEQGLIVHVDYTPTRPTLGLLKETVGVLGRLGVRTIWIRRPRLEWMDSDEHVALSPRLGLLEPELREAQHAANRLGVEVRWVGFSACSVSGLEGQRWHSDAWVHTNGAPVVPLKSSVPCACVVPCEGLPGDYIHRFGWQEFQQGPATRVREVSRRVMSPNGAFLRSGKRSRLRLEFGGPVPDLSALYNDEVVFEASRDIRIRMVEASQTGTPIVEVCNSGILNHPDAEELLRELTRLSFERVRLAGDLALLAEGSERLFRRYKGIHEVYAVWYGPDIASHDALCGVPGAREASMEALDKFRRFSGSQTAAYAMIQHADQLDDYLDVFRRYEWTPHFRCCATSDALVGIGERLHHIKDPWVQRQLGSQLPDQLWSGPRAEVVSPLPAWGAGISHRLSRLDPLLGVNPRKRLAG